MLLLGVTSASASVLKIYLYNDENSDPNDKLTTRLEAREGFWRDAASLVLAPDLLNGEIGDHHPGREKGDDEEDGEEGTISTVLGPDKIDGDLFHQDSFPQPTFQVNLLKLHQTSFMVNLVMMIRSRIMVIVKVIILTVHDKKKGDQG